MRTYYQTQLATRAKKQVQEQPKKTVKKVDGKKFVNKAANDINAPTNYWRHFDMKRFWIIFGITLGLFAVLLILSSTIDFDISWGLANSKFENRYIDGVPAKNFSYYSTNAWDNLVESFGEAPGFLICMFGLWLMAFPFFFVDKNKRTWYRTTCQIIIPTFLIFTAIYIMYYYNKTLGFGSYFSIVGGSTNKEVNYFVSSLFSLIFNGLALVIIFKFRQTTRISLAKLGALFVFAFIFSEAFIWILKYDVGLNRERFRAIMLDPRNLGPSGCTIDKSLAEKSFHEWWQKTPESDVLAWYRAVPESIKSKACKFNPDGTIKSIGNAFSSFPSGHSSLAACTMALCFLPCCYDKAGNKQWKGYVIWLCALAVTFTVMFSRVGAGAHYLSDTTIGFFFGTMGSFIMGMVIFKVPKVSNYLQNMNINGKWYEFLFVPALLPAAVWIVSNALTWA